MLSAHRARSSAALPATFALLASTTACAEEHCSASGGVNARLCSLGGYLHTLYAVAALLGAILIVVIVLAIAYYRKAQRMKLEP